MIGGTFNSCTYGFVEENNQPSGKFTKRKTKTGVE